MVYYTVVMGKLRAKGPSDSEQSFGGGEQALFEADRPGLIVVEDKASMAFKSFIAVQVAVHL